jgi:hypothetical protein
MPKKRSIKISQQRSPPSESIAAKKERKIPSILPLRYTTGSGQKPNTRNVIADLI